MSLPVHKSLTFALIVLAFAVPAAAQVAAGEASLNLNGTVSVGYGDDYTNNAGSDHSIAGAGNADLSGYYFNPNFLSFDIAPFYNQSRLNSNYQSMTGASGVSASAKFFSGSPFGGSVSYSATFNSSGNFNVPGLANYTTHGNSETFGVNWGIHLKDYPTLNLSFTNANNGYSVYGAETPGTMHENAFSATSGYHIAGFSLNGGYQYNGNRTLTPEFLAGGPAEPTDSGTQSFFFGVGHSLPFHGAFSANAVRMDLHTAYGDSGSTDNYTTDIDTLSSSVNFAPVNHLNVGANAYYTDNLEGTLYNTLVTAGAILPGTESQTSSHDLNLVGNVNYEMPAEHLDFQGYIQRQQQTYLGESFISDSFNGTATYSNALFGGQFNGVLGLTDTAVNSSHEDLLGINASINYTHPVQRWTLTGGLAYSQNTQTVLINYTTSNYNYFGSVGRKINRKTYWSASASGMRSLLTDVPDSANSSQSYTTTFSVSRVSFGGAYSKSSGNALLTTTGLVSTPIPVTALPASAVVLYNGTSYSLNVGATPIRGLTVSGVWAKALNGTSADSTMSNNNSNNMYFLLMYHLRKLDVQAGYSRLLQGFSGTGVPPALEGSIFVGVSRYFNFF